IVARRDEPAPAGYEPLLQPVMRAGRRINEPDTLAAARQRFETDFSRLPADARDLWRPRSPGAECSVTLARLQAVVQERFRGSNVVSRVIGEASGSVDVSQRHP